MLSSLDAKLLLCFTFLALETQCDLLRRLSLCSSDIINKINEALREFN